MTLNPLVSIIIPVYNGSNYLKEAIDSAISQTYENIEVIVVDDGSNDDGRTEKIAKSYKDKIRYFHKANGGVASALNFGIKVMNGEYFSWLSHDDVYYKEKISVQMNLMIASINPVILYSDFDFIDSNSIVLRSKHVKSFSKDKFLISLINSHSIHGCTLLIPKICFEDLGDFNEKLKTTQDYDLWFRFAKKYEFKHIPQVLVKSRVHAEQDSNKLSEIKIKETTDYYKNSVEFLVTDYKKKYKKCYLKFILLLSFFKIRLKGYREASCFIIKKFLNF
ncbi:MAG: glycosyltransferase [Actinomycetota bacterium]|nr:glycosyltransferase [Actinomycetota bacterium]